MSDENEKESGRAGDRGVCRGQIIMWEGRKCIVQGRRVVDGFAMFQTSTHELLLAALDGGDDPGWVGQDEVQQPAGE